MTNPYAGFTASTIGAVGSFPVTPSDSVDLASHIRQVTISGSGTIAWRNWNGEIETTGVLPPGSYAMMARRIMATGTTATGLTGWV